MDISTILITYNTKLKRTSVKIRRGAQEPNLYHPCRRSLRRLGMCLPKYKERFIMAVSSDGDFLSVWFRLRDGTPNA